MKMKRLTLLSLSLAVALGMPPFVPDVAQNPVLTKEEESPLLGDLVPKQGHVVVEDPLPQVRLGSKEQQEKLDPLPVDLEQSQSIVELEVKVKPDVKAEPEVKAEQEGKEKTEVKVEQELEAEREVQPEPEVKEQLDVKQDVKGNLEVNPEINLNPEVRDKLAVKVKSDGKENTDVEVEQELKAEPEVQEESDVKVDLEANVDPEINLNPKVMAELEVKVEPEVEVQPELKDDPDFKVESEVKMEPDEATEPEEMPLFNEEEFQVQMSLEPESETGQEFEERHIDMDGKYEMVGEPIMELEPLDGDNMFEEELSNTELSEVETSMRAAVQDQYQPLPEEEVMGEQEYVSDGEPIMALEPETREESILHQQVMRDATVMEEGPALDIMGRRMRSVEDYFPNEEARMGMEPRKLQDNLMMEEPERESFREEWLSPVLDDHRVLDGDAQIDVVPVREKKDLARQGVKNPEEEALSATGQSCYPGVVLERKCYQFFTGPKRAADAEFFCQEHFPGGHLASITSPHIHREVMKMMLQQNGKYTRTWIGGLRYLDTGRFVWLDGSHWRYADWLSGEPNNTAAVENCLEVLGNGKFNDFTCWEPLAFICSHPY